MREGSFSAAHPNPRARSRSPGALDRRPERGPVALESSLSKWPTGTGSFALGPNPYLPSSLDTGPGPGTYGMGHSGFGRQAASRAGPRGGSLGWAGGGLGAGRDGGATAAEGPGWSRSGTMREDFNLLYTSAAHNRHAPAGVRPGAGWNKGGDRGGFGGGHGTGGDPGRYDANVTAFGSQRAAGSSHARTMPSAAFGASTVGRFGLIPGRTSPGRDNRGVAALSRGAGAHWAPGGTGASVAAHVLAPPAGAWSRSFGGTRAPSPGGDLGGATSAPPEMPPSPGVARGPVAAWAASGGARPPSPGRAGGLHASATWGSFAASRRGPPPGSVPAYGAPLPRSTIGRAVAPRGEPTYTPYSWRKPGGSTGADGSPPGSPYQGPHAGAAAAARARAAASAQWGWGSDAWVEAHRAAGAPRSTHRDGGWTSRPPTGGHAPPGTPSGRRPASPPPTFRVPRVRSPSPGRAGARDGIGDSKMVDSTPAVEERLMGRFASGDY